MIFQKWIEKIKCFFIGLLFGKEIEQEEFGYYSPSKWHFGIDVMAEIRKYKILKKMWHNRRRNLQRRKT